MTDCNRLGWRLFLLHYLLLWLKTRSCILHIRTVWKSSNIISCRVSFCLSWVSTSFLRNSTSVANKAKANIELSSLCPLHLSQIFFLLQRSLRKWERKKETERNEAIEIVSTHRGKSQWFLKVAMDTNPACMDEKKMFCQDVSNSSQMSAVFLQNILWTCLHWSLTKWHSFLLLDRQQ